jgi:hypothetical protein
LASSLECVEKLYEKGPPAVVRYSSRYEKTLPNGPFRCPMELHRTSLADIYRAWTTEDPQPPRDPKRHLLRLEKRLPVVAPAPQAWEESEVTMEARRSREENATCWLIPRGLGARGESPRGQRKVDQEGISSRCSMMPRNCSLASLTCGWTLVTGAKR